MFDHLVATAITIALEVGVAIVFFGAALNGMTLIGFSVVPGPY